MDEVWSILEEAPDGRHFANIVNEVLNRIPGANPGSVSNWTYELQIKNPEKVTKPARGLYLLSKFQKTDDAQQKQEVTETIAKGLKEEDFYGAFAEYLVNDLEECTLAIPLGGNKFGGKWGTPDVIGKWQSAAWDIIKVPTEIVSAEVKIDTSQLITAFGQACAYKLFSHKVYLVIPRSAGPVDVARLEALCLTLGIGLVLFNKNDPNEPGFEIRVRAIHNQPDNFYLNENIAHVQKKLFS